MTGNSKGKPEKLAYHMQDQRGYAGIHLLTEDEAEALRNPPEDETPRTKWLVVPAYMVKESVSGHLHVMDSHGQYVGSRQLDAVQAGDLVRQGYHLVHVGDGSKDMEEIKALQDLNRRDQ